MAPTTATASLHTNDFPELFEGPEKTLSLCFKARRIANSTLRAIPREAWEKVLKHAKCEILSVIESAPVELRTKKKEKATSSKGVTAYLLSESSLFVMDHSLVLKTCGRTTPLAALEPLLDLAVPSWRQREPEQYMQYATFMRLGYMRPDEQLDPHTTWEQEVASMNKIFHGEDVVLGSKATSKQHVYVANYLPKHEIVDVFSTQVALTDLDTSVSMRKFGGDSPDDMTPLKTAWHQLHGTEKRSVAAQPVLDERFFEPIGYSSNAVFGKHFTTVHITPQPGCSYLSVETSMPLTRDARQQFVAGVDALCQADALNVTEFSLCPKLFAGDAAPDIAGFELIRSSKTVGSGFACAHHDYRRAQVLPPWLSQRSPSIAPSSAISSTPATPNWQLNVSCDVVEEIENLPRLPPISCEELEPHAVEVPSSADSVTCAAEFLLSLDDQIAKDKPIALIDVSVLRRQAETWHRLLPRVEPHYAVKCNPQPEVVKALWEVFVEHGVGGFDCASPAEMELVLSLPGLEPGKHIVYANPCKQASAITFSQEVGVRRLVFDSCAELEKLAKLYPTSELLLRVQTDDSLAQCPLSNKFGAAVADCGTLIAQAAALNLTVVGVSFHVGSGCSKVGAFRSALERARAVFDEAERQGLKLTLLDIGGGFPGMDEPGHATFTDHADDISEMLEKLFPSRDVQVIAEPGRFFVASAQAMLTMVISVAESSKGYRYYLNDGLYGSFNCLLFDHAHVSRPIILREGKLLDLQDCRGLEVDCTIFGPTCDGFDMITDSMPLPRLLVGDRLLFSNMGAYTSAASTSFNGFALADRFTYRSKNIA